MAADTKRVAELEAELDAERALARDAESQLADLRGRVARAETYLQASSRAEPEVRAALEALRSYPTCPNCKGKKVFPTGWECSQCKGSGLS